jgi:hypothetical protein
MVMTSRVNRGTIPFPHVAAIISKDVSDDFVQD